MTPGDVPVTESNTTSSLSHTENVEEKRQFTAGKKRDSFTPWFGEAALCFSSSCRAAGQSPKQPLTNSDGILVFFGTSLHKKN